MPIQDFIDDLRNYRKPILYTIASLTLICALDVNVKVNNFKYRCELFIAQKRLSEKYVPKNNDLGKIVDAQGELYKGNSLISPYCSYVVSESAIQRLVAAAES